MVVFIWLVTVPDPVISVVNTPVGTREVGVGVTYVENEVSLRTADSSGRLDLVGGIPALGGITGNSLVSAIVWDMTWEW